MTTPPPFLPTVEIQVAGVWLDVTQRARDVPVQVRRGSSDESAQSQPATCEVTFDNEDGYLTPGNAMSPWWPDVDVGMPMRVSAPDCIPHLRSDGATGNEITTPDHASLDITGAIWLAGEVSLADWHDFDESGSEQVIIEKWGTAGNRSYRLVVNAGAIYFMWSPDGTAENFTAIVFAPVASDGRMAVGCWWVPNNGAGTTETHFYTAPRLDGPWTDLDPGFDDGFVGTSSIFSSSSTVRAGRVDGRLWAAEIRSGVITGPNTGTLAASPDLTAQTPGATSFADSTGKTWTRTGTATIDDRDVRFHGAVDSIEMVWPKATQRDSGEPAVAHVNVSASVAMRRMIQGRKPLDSTLKRHVTSPSVADLVVDYWPFEDGRDSTTIANAVPGGGPLRISGEYSLASDDSLDASNPVLNVASGQRAYMSGPIRPIPQVVGVQWEVTRFFRIDEPAVSPAGTNLLAVDTNGRVATWRVNINDTQVGIGGKDADDVDVVLTSFASDARFFDTWAMIVLTVVDDGVNVDWEVNLVPIPLGSIFGTSGTFVGNTGIPTYFRNGLTGPPSGVSAGHLIVTSGTTVGWLAGADTGWVNETAAHRFARLCLEERLPHAVIGDPATRQSFRGDTTRSVLMGPQRPVGLLDIFEECANVDQGRLFERRDDLGLVFRTCQSLYNQDPAVTFYADRELVAPFTPVKDTQRRRNYVTVSRPNGSSVDVTTDPAPAPVDLYDTSVEANVYADEQLGDQAGWRLHLGTSSAMRYPGYNAELVNAGEMARHAWCQLDIGDITRADRLMDQHDETVDTVLEGYTETLDGWTWTVGINASPAGPWTVGVRGDTVLGRRDDADTSLATAMTLTGTAAAVDVVWTQEAADYPFDLDIGGERVTATAGVIFGAFIFTVVRGVNGVQKAHPIGTQVRLWQPTIRAF